MATCKTKAELLAQFADSPTTPLAPTDFQDLLASRFGNGAVLYCPGTSQSIATTTTPLTGFTQVLSESGCVEAGTPAFDGGPPALKVTKSGTYLIVATASMDIETELTYLTVRKWSEGAGSSSSLSGAATYVKHYTTGTIACPATVMILASLSANDWVYPATVKATEAARTVYGHLFSVVRIA